MAKDPAFLFYPSDFNDGTQDFTFEEVGAYIRILLFQFSQGHLPIERIKRKLGPSFEVLWPILSTKFSQDEIGNFYNVRLDSEITKRQAFSESRRKNISKRYEKEVNNISSTYEDTSVSHMENENEDENGIKEPEIKEPEKPKSKNPEIPSESEFMAYYKSELSKEFPGLEFSIKTKYETWVDLGWKDGNGNKIGNWKLKLKNTIPHLKAKFDPNKPQPSGPLSFSSKNMNR